MSGTREGERERARTCAHVSLCVVRAVDVAVHVHPRAGTSGRASPMHKDTCVCRPVPRSWHASACACVWLCTCLRLCSRLQSVAGEIPWPLRGHMSLCRGGFHHGSWLGAPLDSSSGPFSPKKKGHVSWYYSLSCSWALSCRINTATTLRGADMVQNTSPPSPCPLGPCSACRGGTDALQPALDHHARCKSGAEPEAAIYGVLGGCCPPPRQPHQGSPATRRGSPCSKPPGRLHPSWGPRCDKPLGCSSWG